MARYDWRWRNFPELKRIELTDYKVRILDGVAGTAARTRCSSSPPTATRMGTVGVSENIIEPAWRRGGLDGLCVD